MCLIAQNLTTPYGPGMISLVLTILGPDRVGLVEVLSDTIAKHDANWLESRMAQLAGKFAGLLHISVSSDNAEALVSALNALESQGIKVLVARSEEKAPAASQTVVLELIGNDRPGIVSEISRALAGHGVNVEELQTEVAAAPMSGDPLFKALAELRVPAGMSLDTLGATLEHIANDLMVELDLRD